MKLEKWLILSALLVGASVQAAEDPAAKPVEPVELSVLQKAEEGAKKSAEEAKEATRKAAEAAKRAAEKAEQAVSDASQKTAEAARQAARDADDAAKLAVRKTAEATRKATAATKEAAQKAEEAAKKAAIATKEAAQKAGRFKDEIVPLQIPQKKGTLTFDSDEYPKHGTTLESLAALRPAFSKEGTVTAGNASGLNDGAAAVMMMSARRAEQLGLTPLARIKAYSSAGLDPSIMGMGPVSATKLCLQKAGWTHEDLDLMEINEAFAAQAIAVNRQMGWDTSKINVNGGAIALGHPIGASGCRILVSLLHEMVRRDAKRGLASLCIGGGMGVALAVER